MPSDEQAKESLSSLSVRNTTTCT